MARESPDIDYLSRLAALRFDAAESERAGEDIARIIDMIEAMRGVDTDGVEPLAHPLEAIQRLRADKITEQPDTEELQSGAPVARDGFFLVPRVVD